MQIVTVQVCAERNLYNRLKLGLVGEIFDGVIFTYIAHIFSLSGREIQVCVQPHATLL